jgi:hypothetical protein
VLVGGDGPGVLDRVLAFGDAWFPNHAPDGILERAAELRSRADRPVDLMVMGVPADARALETYANAGFRRALHWLPSAPPRAGRAGARPVRDGDRGALRGLAGGRLTAGGLTARVAKYPGM